MGWFKTQARELDQISDELDQMERQMALQTRGLQLSTSPARSEEQLTRLCLRREVASPRSRPTDTGIMIMFLVVEVCLTVFGILMTLASS